MEGECEEKCKANIKTAIRIWKREKGRKRDSGGVVKRDRKGKLKM